MDRKSTQHRKKKYRIRKGRVIAAAAVFVGIILLVVFLCVYLSGRGNNKKKNNQLPTVNINEIVSEGEFVSIDMEDCNLYVGTVLSLSCTSNPSDYAGKVIWSSSDDGIVSVSSKGQIEVISEGTVAITATYGVLSDSVVINGIAKDVESVPNEMPVYNVVDGETVLESVKEPSTSQGADGNHGNDATDSTESSKDNEQNTSSGDINDQPSETETEPSKEKEEMKALFEEAVRDAGFGVYVDNTYIFKEDGNYLGEIILEESYAQIYIMTRTTTFDNAVKQVIKTALPESYEDIFAQAVSAVNDRTFSSDGHRVRIIAAVNGGHTQLIIYY